MLVTVMIVISVVIKHLTHRSDVRPSQGKSTCLEGVIWRCSQPHRPTSEPRVTFRHIVVEKTRWQAEHSPGGKILSGHRKAAGLEEDSQRNTRTSLGHGHLGDGTSTTQCVFYGQASSLWTEKRGRVHYVSIVHLHDLIYYSQHTCEKGAIVPIVPLRTLGLREGHMPMVTQWCESRLPPQPAPQDFCGSLCRSPESWDEWGLQALRVVLESPS